MEKSGKKHLSMLRSYTTADLFTIGNATCGTLSIFLCLNFIAEGKSSFLWIAFLLLFAALFFDIFDGYWARRSGRQSILGADLDSLSDIISFGVAPAVLGFTLGMRGGWDMLILAFFVVCGISRLARFNEGPQLSVRKDRGHDTVLRESQRHIKRQECRVPLHHRQ